MSKNTIKGFFCNKVFFVFVGLFVLVTLAYLFADGGMGAHHIGLKGFYCKPEGNCAGGVRITVEGSGLSAKPSDGCTRKPNGECSGTCYWCDPSNDTGRHCVEMIEYSGTCFIDIPNTSMSCGESRSYRCQANGGHGITGCCPPDKNKNTEGKGICTSIATCVSIDE